MLVDAGFEPQRVDRMAARVLGQVIDQAFAKTPPSKLGPHVHSLQLAALCTDEPDPAPNHRPGNCARPYIPSSPPYRGPTSLIPPHPAATPSSRIKKNATFSASSFS